MEDKTCITYCHVWYNAVYSNHVSLIGGSVLQILLDQFIDSMMQSLQCSAHVKDLKTGKYICSNLINVRKFGFSKPEDIVGATIHDLNDFMLPFWGKDILPNTIQQEYTVMHTGRPTIDKNRDFLTKDGFICVHYMTKTPIPNINGMASSVLTMSENITDKLTLEQLWDMYKKYYLMNKQVAIQKYLTHIGVFNLFNEYPTEAEIRILLARAKADSYKKIADLLGLSTKTVESHISNLRKKTKNLDLASVIYSIKIADPHAVL